MKKSILWRMAALGTLTLFSNGSLAGCDQAWRFNPCGTILSTNICTSSEWLSALFDSPDWDVDPTCPIPGQCG